MGLRGPKPKPLEEKQQDNRDRVNKHRHGEPEREGIAIQVPEDLSTMKGQIEGAIRIQTKILEDPHMGLATKAKAYGALMRNVSELHEVADIMPEVQDLLAELALLKAKVDEMATKGLLN